MATAFTELRAHGLVSGWDNSLSPEYSHENPTRPGTACAAASLHCLETQAQTAIAWTSRKLRTVMRSTRGSAPAGATAV